MDIYLLSKIVELMIILPVVLYGYKTWSSTEHMSIMFEDRVLRIIYASSRDGVTESWRRLYNEFIILD